MTKDTDNRPSGAIPIKTPMTQEQCENWIQLKGQTGVRWFEIRILDPEIQDEPAMASLMEAVSEMIFKGIQGMPFTEAEQARAQGADNPMKIVDPSGKPLSNGDDAA